MRASSSMKPITKASDFAGLDDACIFSTRGQGGLGAFKPQGPGVVRKVHCGVQNASGLISPWHSLEDKWYDKIGITITIPY